jgi:DNA-binding LacI/PurR family transcriptional regulator
MVLGGVQKAARLADVAKAAGVSQGTVSNVFNRPSVVRQEVREHVRAVAQSLGYRGPDPKGRLLRAGKFNAIGVATTEPLAYFFEDPFARVLMEGMSEACDAHGAGLSLVSAQNSERLAWNIESALVDGFVLLCIEGGERLVQLTRERNLPFVALAHGKPDGTVSAIGIDDYAGAKLAATHLAELGHRRFGVLAIQYVDNHVGPVAMTDVEAAAYSTTRDRTYGYFAALDQFGIDTDRIPIFETENEPESVAAGLAYLFALTEPPTALLCMSDRVALIALEWLASHGIEVPGEVSIIGFDGVPEAAKSTPRLATIAQPIAEIGRRAIEAIIKDDGAVHREILPVELIIGGSTGPAPS